MSQIDYVHFLPTLIWVLILFFIFYVLLIIIVIPLIYKTLRIRKIQEEYYWKNILKEKLKISLSIKLVEKEWKNQLKKLKKIIIVENYKNLI